jgi:hypothetical protein
MLKANDDLIKPSIEPPHPANTEPEVSDYNAAVYASLLHIPGSEEAYRLRAALRESVFPKMAKRRGRPINIDARQDAALAFVADILTATRRDRGRWVYRSLNANAFSQEPVGYRAFLGAVEALEGAGLVMRLKGNWNRKNAFGELSKGFGRAARWLATPMLLALCEAHGITPQNASDHLRLRQPRRSIILRRSSVRLGHLKAKGQSVRYPATAQVHRLEGEVSEINRLLANYEIRGATHRGFRRVFNQGDDPALRPAKGGSFYTPVASISLVHLLDNPLPHRMRIPHQHPDVPMTAD